VRAPTRPTRRRASLASELSIAVMLVATGCAQPIAGLWPPPEGSPSHRVVVSVDSWHSVVGIYPRAAAGREGTADLEEWSYAERQYYLEGNSAFSGSMRAVFWPSAGVVQVHRGGPPYSERAPQLPVQQWTFQLGDEGFQRLLEWLHASRASAEPISAQAGSLWYEASSSYHGFHQCHHWTANALRAAGLPVWSFYAFTRRGLETQLDRCAEIARESSPARARNPHTAR